MIGNSVNIAGVVLAGGQSLRMGQDKAQLIIEQHSLLSRAVALLHNVGLKDCFVSGDYKGFNCIIDQQPALGPIAGLAACVTQLNCDYDAIFIIPVDMPLLAPEDCSNLLQQFINQNESNKQGLYYQDAIFPMLLVLNSTLSDYLQEVVNSSHKKHRSLYRLLNTLDIKAINNKESDAFRFENTNTPEQWDRCLSTYAKMQPHNK